VARDQGDERRTIDELETRYLLEPELGDVYVEGPSDAALIAWFLNQEQHHDWRVYPIDTVDVSATLVHERGLDTGERGEVLTLGLELSERLRDVPGRMPVMIADRDSDALLDDWNPGCDLCLLTDFTTMEMYAYNPESLDKLIRLFMWAKRITSDELMRILSPALIDIFLVRVVLQRTEGRIKTINEVTRCCTRGDEGVVVDIMDLVRRSINAPTDKPRPAVITVLNEVSALRSLVPGDVRRTASGDDLVKLLSWVFQAYGVDAELRRPEVVKRALMLCLEAGDLSKYRLFTELLRRTSP